MKFIALFMIFFAIVGLEAIPEPRYSCPQWDVDFVGNDMLDNWISVESWEDCGKSYDTKDSLT